MSALKNIDIGIGPVGVAYGGIMNEVSEMIKGSKSFSAVYIEGRYGTGKTLVLRRAIYDIVSGENKKVYERVIPIYFFLGTRDFDPLVHLRIFIDDVKTYLDTGLVKPNVVGEKEDWEIRYKLLEDTWQRVQPKLDAEGSRQIESFFSFMRELNKSGYLPMLIFDEFERLIYTGDVLREERSRPLFVEFVKRYFELTRDIFIAGSSLLLLQRE